MIANRKLNYVYCAPGKTGSLSMRQWLTNYYYGERIASYHQMIVPGKWKDVPRFITVRNPYERMWSLWWFVGIRGTGPQLNGWSFKKTCEWEAECKRSLSEEYDQCGATLALKIEDIAQEVRKLTFFNPRLPLPVRTRIGDRKPNPSFFDRFSRDSMEAQVVRRLFADDFERFGYTP